MRRFFRENGLSIALFVCFLIFLIGQTTAGFHTYNDDRRDHQRPEVPLGAYLRSGHFIEATFENWESEFLQMGSYVLFTVWLRQRGSPESKPLEGEPDVDAEPADPKKRRGLTRKLYENSLTLALFGLFLASFGLHAWGGVRNYNEAQAMHGAKAIGFFAFLGTSAFWFQSFQNWQSEFLSVGVLVVLSIFLRQKGSPESKPVDAPNDQTGDE